MSIYHRIRVWLFKGYRFIRYGFKKRRARTYNAIWVLPVVKKCDFCKEQKRCVVLECDWEVEAVICDRCLEVAKNVLRIQ